MEFMPKYKAGGPGSSVVFPRTIEPIEKERAMNIACADATVVTDVRAVLQRYGVSHIRQQGPNLGAPTIWVMVGVVTNIGNDKENALRREITQVAGAAIRS